MVDVREVQEFFFKAMLGGYAAGAKKTPLPGVPGFKLIPFREGNLTLFDSYTVNPESGKSAGTTIIWYKDVPVWMMACGGFYEKEAVPFLKRALLHAYERKEFVGGRGPLVFKSDTLIYTNSPHLNTFERFGGRESVFDEVMGDSLGWHGYWGMSLV